MEWFFILNSIMLGFGLAMDAFCVSMTNGLTCRTLRIRDRLIMAGTYAGFQFLMPIIGWICVHTISERFALFHRMVPWIALLLLLYIGGKMLLEAWQIRQDRLEQAAPKGEAAEARLDPDHDISLKESQTGPAAEAPSVSAPTMISWAVLLMQGIATSIDALSVGFTIADYSVSAALAACLIIAFVTLLVCLTGIRIGQVLGNILEEKANVLGGCILIFIGLEIFIKGVIL